MIRSVFGIFNSSQGLAAFGRSLVFSRSARHQAFDAAFDQDGLAEARKWHSSFNEDSIPKGQISFSRSSGPGGQHVNKYGPSSTVDDVFANQVRRTESKATTVWPVSDLIKTLPKLMHAGLRLSKYYTKGNDSLTIQAQSQRSRSANIDENNQKLVEELSRIYKGLIPGATSAKKMKKYEDLEKTFHEGRVRSKKQHSAKKTSRKASFND